eukprot:NODE_25681_length_578_cov_4.164080.p2 GENE.NODE_25681_length_578_cov_4.164080~~NODE_25681_length_578_cov_4.164080.p2  ORF type:complete len:98 (-),score=10.40 NODE_25681_length_578_cov_4.164080:256-549(-)
MHLPLLKDGTVGSDESYNMYAALHHAHTAIVWEDELWGEFPGAGSLCQTLLAWNVEDRPLNAEAALQHDWLCGCCWFCCCWWLCCSSRCYSWDGLSW